MILYMGLQSSLAYIASLAGCRRSHRPWLDADPGRFGAVGFVIARLLLAAPWLSLQK